MARQGGYSGFCRAVRRAAAIGWFAACALLCAANQASAKTVAVLDPVHDPDLAAVLADSFSLPLLLELEGRTKAQADAELAAELRSLAGVLTSLGYLNARVETEGAGTQAQPLRLIPVPGERYRIGQLDFDGLPPGAVATLAPRLAAVLSRNLGRVAAQGVLGQIAKDVLWVLREASYAQAAVEVFAVRSDPDTRTAAISVSIDPGVPVTFGAVRFSGTLRMDEEQAQALVPFQPGEPFSATAVDALQSALEQTGLFRRIRIELPQAASPRGRIDVDVELRDIAPDPVVLAESSGHGPTQLVLTMLMIVLWESVRVTSYWMHVSLRRALSVPVVLSVADSGHVVFVRLYDFLF